MTLERDWVGLGTIASLLDCDVSTVRRNMIEAHRWSAERDRHLVPAVRFGGRWRVPRWYVDWLHDEARKRPAGLR